MIRSAPAGHNSDPETAGGQLRAFVERIERIEVTCERCDKSTNADEIMAPLHELKRDIEMHILKTTGTL